MILPPHSWEMSCQNLYLCKLIMSNDITNIFKGINVYVSKLNLCEYTEFKKLKSIKHMKTHTVWVYIQRYHKMSAKVHKVSCVWENCVTIISSSAADWKKHLHFIGYVSCWSKIPTAWALCTICLKMEHVASFMPSGLSCMQAVVFKFCYSSSLVCIFS
jgi:hypothetical protein